jgi:hypothetical protein
MDSAADAGELTDLLDQCHSLMTAAERRFVEAVRHFEAAECYRIDGARTMVDWLVERYSMSRDRAYGFVAVATGLGTLPLLETAYENGDVTLDQLRPIVKVADHDNEELLAREMPGWTEAQCREVARRLKAMRLEERNEVHRKRFFRWRNREDRFTFSGQITLEDGAIIEALIHKMADAIPPDATGRTESFSARAADALVETCSNGLAGEQRHDADIATVICHIDVETAAGGEGDSAVGETHQPIPAETARRLLCDCRFQPWKENADGEVIGLGRTTRTVPRWLRRSLHRRDGGCRFPSCERQAWVDRHHIQHWTQGGATDPKNLIELCRYHHRFVHEHGWKILGNPADEVRFVAPDGREAISRPEPARRTVLERFGLWLPDGSEPDPPPIPALS